MRFHIHTEREGPTRRLYLCGELDLAAVETLRDAIITALADGTGAGLVIDLDAVGFLDCGAVGVLVHGRNRANETGLGYRLVGARGQPLMLLRMLGLEPATPARADG